jgi:hypothetical protein
MCRSTRICQQRSDDHQISHVELAIFKLALQQ